MRDTPAAALGRPSVADVWIADLDRCHDALEAFARRTGCLSAGDIGRAAAAGGATAQRRRLTTYTALRWVLECRLGEDWRARDFEYSPAGKPTLAGSRVSFSLAHCEHYAAIACADFGPLGIDIEEDRAVALPVSYQDDIVTAAAALGTSDGGAPDFLAAWTRIEAFAKARGTGMMLELRALGVRRHGAAVARLDPAQLTANAARQLADSGLCVTGLVLPAGLFGAIAAPAGRAAAAPRFVPADWPGSTADGLPQPVVPAPGNR